MLNSAPVVHMERGPLARPSACDTSWMPIIGNFKRWVGGCQDAMADWCVTVPEIFMRPNKAEV